MLTCLWIFFNGGGTASAADLPALVSEAAAAALRQHFAAQPFSLFLRPLGEPRSPQCPSVLEVIEVRTNGIGALPRPRMSAIVMVRCSGERDRAIPLWYAAEAPGEVWVALADLVAGIVPTMQQFEPARRDWAALQSRPVIEAKSIEGRRLATALRRGMPLTEAALEPVPEIAAGRPVTVRARMGSVQVEAEMVARDDGRRGDIIHVRRPGTGELLRARVLATGTAEVLPP